VPETLGPTAAALVPEAAAVLAAELASLEPPQPARAAMMVRTARPWPRIPQILLVNMSHRLAIR